MKAFVNKILDCDAGIASLAVYGSNFNILALIAKQIKKNSLGTLIVF